MKKFVVFGLIFVSLFISCKTPVDEVVIPPEIEQPVVKSFEDSVQEVYEMAGATLYYSLDGKTPDIITYKVMGPNEKPGVCTDYAIEFAYYWNEVMNYDDLFGKAYLVMSWSDGTITIMDGDFVPNGTSKIREQTGKFGQNANLQEADGVWRDVIFTDILYTGRNIKHFGEYVGLHMWPVIKFDDDWYDTEPTWYDVVYNEYYIPNKITF
jgi:hypothetical protein